MRAFIAIEISDEIKMTLEKVEAHLKYAGADVKWVKPDIIHLTLKFLGEISDEKCESVKSALDASVKSVELFEMTLKDIGVFPDAKHPRVVWAGLEKGADETVVLAEKVEEAMATIGFDRDDRPFKAHLTIGRVRSSLNKDNLKDKIDSASSVIRQSGILPHKVKSVALFQSTLTQQGPAYTKLHESALIG